MKPATSDVGTNRTSRFAQFQSAMRIKADIRRQAFVE
jgi:hypothetical protein